MKDIRFSTASREARVAGTPPPRAERRSAKRQNTRSHSFGFAALHDLTASAWPVGTGAGSSGAWRHRKPYSCCNEKSASVSPCTSSAKNLRHGALARSTDPMHLAASKSGTVCSSDAVGALSWIGPKDALGRHWDANRSSARKRRLSASRNLNCTLSLSKTALRDPSEQH